MLHTNYAFGLTAIAGLLILPCVANGQQMNVDPLGLDSLKSDATPLARLQSPLPSFNSMNPIQDQGLHISSVEQSLGAQLSSQTGIAQVETKDSLRAAVQPLGLKPTSTVVWSDNRGTWKFVDPGPACLLQTSSGINTDTCN